MVRRLIVVPSMHCKRSKGTKDTGEAEEHQRSQVQERISLRWFGSLKWFGSGG